jgi:GNAT superfamily N-acetyltransferase
MAPDGGDITIGPAQTADATAIADALQRSVREVAHDYYAPHLIDRWIAEYSPARALAMIESDDFHVIVARAADGAIVGVGSLHLSDQRVTQCYVTGAVQGTGVGARLLAALEQAAIEAGLAWVHLQSSTGARAFYERNGYAPSGPAQLFDDRFEVYPYRKALTPAGSTARPEPRP